MPELLVSLLPDLHSADGSLASRRRDFWQGMARRAVAGAIFSYDEHGAPMIEGSQLHISVSHSRTAAAVLISESPCGIDIETPDRNFHRVAGKYLSPEEACISAHPEFEAMAWCAKEAMYKLWRKGDHTLPQFRITAFDPESDTLSGVLPDGCPVTLHVRRECGNIIVYCTL